MATCHISKNYFRTTCPRIMYDTSCYGCFGTQNPFVMLHFEFKVKLRNWRSIFNWKLRLFTHISLKHVSKMSLAHNRYTKLRMYPEVNYVSIHLVIWMFVTISGRSMRRAFGCLQLIERIKQPRWNGEWFHIRYFAFQRYEIAKKNLLSS